MTDTGLIALGVNHRTASVALREKIAFTGDRLACALAEARAAVGLEEIAILSTCNRTELYCVEGRGASGRILEWFGDIHRLARAELHPFVYEHREQEALRHMSRVACGLDSMVLGEPQILGQMKEAYAIAHQAGTVGQQLDPAFQHTFSVAKQVRTQTRIGASPVSVAYAAVSLARHLFADLRQTEALLIGAGEMIELVARHLQEVGVKKIVIANRTLSRAQSLAEQVGGTAITLDEVPYVLQQSDIVVSCTASTLPILGKGMVERALKTRKHRPIFMVDIAVPRDIEPEVGDSDDVYLYTIDDLQNVIKEGVAQREASAEEAEKIIEERLEAYLRHRRSLDAVSTVKAYREKLQALAEASAEKAVADLQAGQDPAEVMGRYNHVLLNKIMHEPTLALRQAGEQGRQELLEWAQQLFGLEIPDKGKD